jgi:hypothetical protein
MVEEEPKNQKGDRRQNRERARGGGRMTDNKGEENK